MRRSLLTISSTVLSLVMLVSPVMADPGSVIKTTRSKTVTQERAVKDLEGAKLAQSKLDRQKRKASSVNVASPFLQVRSKGTLFKTYQKDGFSRVAAEDGVTLSGNVIYQDGWTQGNTPYGIYSLNAVSPLVTEVVSLNKDLNATGVKAGSEYYVFNYAAADGYLTGVTWSKFSSESWTTTNVITKEMTMTNIVAVAAYDESSEEVYGITFGDATSDYFFTRIDKSFDSAPEIIGSVTAYSVFTLSFAGNGDLYAIISKVKDGEGYLVKIDKSTGVITEVGPTGVFPMYVQSMGFDHGSRKMYWAACDIADNGLLYEVNLTNGAAYPLGYMPLNEEFASLWGGNVAIETGAPAAISDLQVTFATPGILEGSISFVAPSFSVSGSMLLGPVQALILVDDVEVENVQLGIGASHARMLTFTPGLHTVKVKTSNEHGDSPVASAQVYAGFDTPKAVSNLEFVENGEEASVSWSAPSEGVNGGAIDFSVLKYNVYRNPGKICVTSAISGTTYSEPLPDNLGLYSYSVESLCGELTGALATSNALLCGEGLSLPYEQEFRTENNLMLYTIIDANNDGKTWKFAENSLQYSFNSAKAADDWVFTPALSMEGNETYIMTFKLKTASASFPENLKVTFGNSINPAEQETVLDLGGYKNNKWTLQSVEITTQEAGKHFFGFYAYSEADMFKIYVDSIVVRKGVPQGALGVISDFKVSYPVPGELTSAISAKAPAISKSGAPLSGEIQMTARVNGEIVHTQIVSPGAIFSFGYTFPAEGVAVVGVNAANSTGEGEISELQTYAGFSTPMPVEDLQLQISEQGLVTLSWNKPQTGLYDSPYDETSLAYKVIRYPGAVEVSAGQTAIGFAETLPDQLASYYYSVTPSAAGKTGESVSSNKVAFGSAIVPPYCEQFEAADALDLYSVFDLNGDDKTWGYDASGKTVRYAWSSANDADDWLISPPFQFEAETVYKLSFKVKSSSFFGENLRVTMGDEAKPEAQSVELMDLPNLKEDNWVVKNLLITTEQSSVKHFGFYAYSVKDMMYITVDSITVVKYAALKAPGAVTDAIATPAPMGEMMASLSFKTPAVTYGGASLASLSKVELYVNQSEVPAHTFVAPQTGATLDWVHNDPVNGLNSYRLVPYNEHGQGMEMQVSCYCGVDSPDDVTNVWGVSANGGKDAVITWDAPVDGQHGGYIIPSEVKYTVLKYSNSTWTQLATDLTSLSYTDADAGPASGIAAVQYGILAFNSVGDAPGLIMSVSATILLGTPYTLPYLESFPAAALTTSPWVLSVETGAGKWALYNTMSADNDNGCAGVTNASGENKTTMTGTKLTLSDISNPVYSFYVYHNSSYSDDYVLAAKAMFDDARPVVVAEIRMNEASGWVRHEISLTDHIGQTMVPIFESTMPGAGEVFVDVVQVEDMVDYDLEITSFTAPNTIAPGNPAEVVAVVTNRGGKAAAGYQVQFYQDGAAVEVFEGSALESKASAAYALPVASNIMNAGEIRIYSAKVLFASDMNPDNDESEELELHITMPSYPSVTDLNAENMEEGIRLSWSEPYSSVTAPVTDDISAYTPFSTSNIGKWTLHDGDGQTTYSIENLPPYENQYGVMAYQVWTPSLLGMDAETYPMWTPRSGNNCLISWASSGVMPDESQVAPKNDDWLISPEVRGGSVLSFYAMEPTDTYGHEKFEVLVSVSTNSISDFTVLSSEMLLQKGVWTNYTYTLGADVKYFAIRYVSKDIFALLVDDIDYTPADGESMALELQGYNIYRKGVRINDALIPSSSYLDAEHLEDGIYSYAVSTVYNEGESALSNMATVIVSSMNENRTSRYEVTTSSRKITVKGAGSLPVDVYTSDGRKVATVVSASEVISFPVEAGVYIVKVEETPVKVIVRE